MSDDLHTRLQHLEERISLLEGQQIAFRAALALARWFAPLFVAAAGTLVMLLK